VRKRLSGCLWSLVLCVYLYYELYRSDDVVACHFVTNEDVALKTEWGNFRWKMFLPRRFQKWTSFFETFTTSSFLIIFSWSLTKQNWNRYYSSTLESNQSKTTKLVNRKQIVMMVEVLAFLSLGSALVLASGGFIPQTSPCHSFPRSNDVTSYW